MKRAKSVVVSTLWAVIVIAFPVSSGVVIVVSKLNAINSRLIQAAFMCLSMAVPFLYCKFMNIDPKEIMLKGFDQNMSILYSINNSIAANDHNWCQLI